MLLLTGGAGFIGGNFVHHWCNQSSEPVIVLDKLTYAGNPITIEPWCRKGQVQLIQGDICDQNLVEQLLQTYNPRALLHFAAETHVDKSILGPAKFIQTNVVGTFSLLEAIRLYWQKLPASEKQGFRFLHVSTDEVYGSLHESAPPFSETTSYAPNSPYSASKAGGDHLVRAYHHTYGLPTLTTNCSNNYGPYQFPEKLIPLIILNALEKKPLPIYGDGQNIRDWLFVGDHCEAISQVLVKGKPGETYNIGGDSEITNLDIVTLICQKLDVLKPKLVGSYVSQISFVADRPGHDKRYAINANKVKQEIGWHPSETIKSGLEKTIQWYLENNDWLASTRGESYQQWINSNYINRQIESCSR